MTKTKPNTKPFTIRLTADERADLERRAGKQALSDYARSVLFGSGVSARKPKSVQRPRKTTADQKALGQLLALLGKSELATSLRSLSEAARYGALLIVPDTEAALIRACADIAAMKSMLMKALGIRED